MKHKRLSAVFSAGMMLAALPTLPALPASAANKLLGDVTADGTVSVSDGVALSRYVAKWDDITVDKDAADLNQDGEISKEDATILVRYLAGWDGYANYIKPIEVADPNTLRIEKQPKAVAVNYGETAKLETAAAGGKEPYTYQWSMNGDDLDGAEAASYTASASGKYRCYITDAYGNSVQTNSVKVSIHPVISKQPADGEKLMTVETKGGADVKYQWQRMGAGWEDIGGAVGSAYAPAGAGTFRCVVTDADDGYSIPSDEAVFWGDGELIVGNIQIAMPDDAAYGLDLDFPHEHYETIATERPGYSVTQDLVTPVSVPYMISGYYGDFLEFSVDASGKGPFTYTWQLAPTYEDALLGKNFVAITEDSGSEGLGTSRLRYKLGSSDDLVTGFGYLRCLVTDREGVTAVAEFGNPWGFDTGTYINGLESYSGLNWMYPKDPLDENYYAFPSKYFYRDGAGGIMIYGTPKPDVAAYDPEYEYDQYPAIRAYNWISKARDNGKKQMKTYNGNIQDSEWCFYPVWMSAETNKNVCTGDYFKGEYTSEILETVQGDYYPAYESNVLEYLYMTEPPVLYKTFADVFSGKVVELPLRYQRVTFLNKYLSEKSKVVLPSCTEWYSDRRKPLQIKGDTFRKEVEATYDLILDCFDIEDKAQWYTLQSVTFDTDNWLYHANSLDIRMNLPYTLLSNTYKSKAEYNLKELKKDGISAYIRINHADGTVEEPDKPEHTYGVRLTDYGTAEKAKLIEIFTETSGIPADFAKQAAENIFEEPAPVWVWDEMTEQNAKNMSAKLNKAGAKSVVYRDDAYWPPTDGYDFWLINAGDNTEEVISGIVSALGCTKAAAQEFVSSVPCKLAEGVTSKTTDALTSALAGTGARFRKDGNAEPIGLATANLLLESYKSTYQTEVIAVLEEKLGISKAKATEYVTNLPASLLKEATYKEVKELYEALLPYSGVLNYNGAVFKPYSIQFTEITPEKFSFPDTSSQYYDNLSGSSQKLTYSFKTSPDFPDATCNIYLQQHVGEKWNNYKCISEGLKIYGDTKYAFQTSSIHSSLPTGEYRIYIKTKWGANADAASTSFTVDHNGYKFTAYKEEGEFYYQDNGMKMGDTMYHFSVTFPDDNPVVRSYITALQYANVEKGSVKSIGGTVSEQKYANGNNKQFGYQITGNTIEYFFIANADSLFTPPELTVHETNTYYILMSDNSKSYQNIAHDYKPFGK